MKRKHTTHTRHTLSFVPWALSAILIVGISVFSFFLLHKSISICANAISCVGDLTGEFQPDQGSTFMGRSVRLPAALADLAKPKRVLGDTTATKHIFVDLSTQMLTAYEGSNVVLSFPISSGKWRATPTGDFHIWVKLRYAHMEGGNHSDGTYYNLYNVPYTMFFYNDEVPASAGFSLHGAYWHNNFGHPMSHGCVNIRPEDAGKLFDWASPDTAGSTTYATPDHPGTLVTITGETPVE